MADSNFRGPINSMGSLEIDAGTSANILPQDGVSLFYQFAGMPDPRSAPFNKDAFRPGQQAGFAMGGSIISMDNIPQAFGTTQLAAAQVATNAVAVALVTAQPAGVASACSIAVGVPFIPAGTTIATVAAFALDFGFTTGTTTSNSTAVTVIDNRLFSLGQWIVIGGAGNSSASRSLVTQVRAIATANTTGINISPAAATGLSNVPIGQGNLFGGDLLPPASQFGPAAASASGHSIAGMFQAGLAKVINPREMLSRNISIANVTAQTMSCLVSGWDVWGVPMTEVITLTTQTTGAGKKAFKYISSITAGTGSAGGSQQVSFGIGDTFGLPFRNDNVAELGVSYNNAASVNANGWTAAVLTASTSTSGDVRGTLQVSTAIVTGVLATSISATGTNGTSRLWVQQDLSPWTLMNTTPNNTVPMFGVAQSTATT